MQKVRYTGNRGDTVNVAGFTLVAGQDYYLDESDAQSIKSALSQSQQGYNNPVEVTFESVRNAPDLESEEQ